MRKFLRDVIHYGSFSRDKDVKNPKTDSIIRIAYRYNSGVDSGLYSSERRHPKHTTCACIITNG
jgi:hypothetical protein